MLIGTLKMLGKNLTMLRRNCRLLGKKLDKFWGGTLEKVEEELEKYVEELNNAGGELENVREEVKNVL